MDEQVMFQHIGLYVNEFTRDLGTRGRAAVQLMFDMARERGVLTDRTSGIFLNGDLS